jgi:hypothetical protein
MSAEQPMAAPPPGPGKSLTGFYIAIGAVGALFTLGAWLWTPISAWRYERQVTQDFLRNIDRHITMEMELPPDEALGFVQGMLLVGSEGDPKADWSKFCAKPKVTLRCQDAPMAVLLESWCSQVGAGWTIAPTGTNVAGTDRPKLAIIVSDPARIAELERANPRIARLVREYRARLPVAKAEPGMGRGK